MLRDGAPTLALRGDDHNELVGVFPLEVDTRGGREEGVGDRDVLLLRGGRGYDRGYVTFTPRHLPYGYDYRGKQ